MTSTDRRAARIASGTILQEDLPIARPVFSRVKWIALIASGAVPSRKIGRAVVLDLGAVDAFLRAPAASTGSP